MNKRLDIRYDARRAPWSELGKDILAGYHEAPDPEYTDKRGQRLTRAVSDHATRYRPLGRTKGYRERLFSEALRGIDPIAGAKALVSAV